MLEFKSFFLTFITSSQLLYTWKTIKHRGCEWSTQPHHSDGTSFNVSKDTLQNCLDFCLIYNTLCEYGVFYNEEFKQCILPQDPVELSEDGHNLYIWKCKGLIHFESPHECVLIERSIGTTDDIDATYSNELKVCLDRCLSNDAECINGFSWEFGKECNFNFTFQDPLQGNKSYFEKLCADSPYQQLKNECYWHAYRGFKSVNRQQVVITINNTKDCKALCKRNKKACKYGITWQKSARSGRCSFNKNQKLFVKSKDFDVYTHFDENCEIDFNADLHIFRNISKTKRRRVEGLKPDSASDNAPLAFSLALSFFIYLAAL